MDSPLGVDLNKLQEFMARQEIHEVLARYARGVDRADGELLSSCYFDDAIEEHGTNYNGPALEYVRGAIERLKLMGPMAHYLCNTHIEFKKTAGEGDRGTATAPPLRTAWVETYVLTFARFPDADGELVDTFTGGRLCDRFECRDGVWRIAHRRMTFDWNRDVASSEGWCLGMFDTAHPQFHAGSKDREDLSYERF